MTRVWLSALLALISASAQSMLEHAAVTGPAAAGASVGAALGIKLNKALDATAGVVQASSKIETSIKKADVPAAAAGITAPELGPGLPSRGVDPIGRPALPKSQKEPKTVQPVAAPAAVVDSALPAELGKDELLRQVTDLQPGASREQMLLKLGTPASRLSFDEDGRLVERYWFRAGNEVLASVEVKDGAVTMVKPLNP